MPKRCVYREGIEYLQRVKSRRLKQLLAIFELLRKNFSDRMPSSIQPLVSIVTPVYNGEQYLVECIESVLAQTYENWNYTIVNNCSTDSTSDIAKKYVASDPRIRLHNNKSFVPIIENHNVAFGQQSPNSEYCKMLYADDWIYPHCIEEMMRLAMKYPSIGLICSYTLKGAAVAWDGLPHSCAYMSGPDICRWTLLGNPYVFGTPTSMLIRSDIIRTRTEFCNLDNIHADTEMCYEILAKSDFGFVHQVLSFMRTENDGQSSFAERTNTYIAGILSDLIKFGPTYLDRDEYDDRLEFLLQSYYDYLGYNLFKNRSQEFWNYHKSEMTKFGMPFENFRLIKSASARVLDALLNPKRTIENRFGP